MNAILGITRPGDFGADMHALQPAQDLQRPARRRRPRRGPDRRARSIWRRFCRRRSSPRTATRYRLDYDRPQSIGRVRSFFGNVGILVRGYCYIRTLGPDGLRRGQRERGAQRELSAQPREAHLRRCRRATAACTSSSPAPRSCKRRRRSRAMDIAKRLLDFGFHAPTVYFPLVVPEAMMIEPTETESKETLDAFAETLLPDHRGRSPSCCTTRRTRRRSAGRTK